MSLEDKTSGELPERIRTRVAVVGAGAAGLTLSLRLSESIDDVTLIESGGLDLDGKTQGLYEGRQLGLPYYDLAACRLRYFGGTTNHWGGYCRANDPIDYEPRPEAGLPGWPISHTELSPYVAQAAELLGIDSDFFEPARLLENRGLGADSLIERSTNLLETKVFQLAQNIRLGKRFLEPVRTATRLHAFTGLNVTRIALDREERKVEYVEAKTLEGRTTRIEADVFVLCCHAIENARLLLSSDDVVLGGIGNEFDHVGRYFMDHIHVFASRLIPTKRFPAIYDSEFLKRKHLNANIGFREDVLRQNGLLQYYCRFNPHYLEPTTLASRGAVVDRFNEPGDVGFLRDVATLISDFPDVARYELSKRSGNHILPDYYILEHRLEQAPNADSRVILSSRRDALGSRIADLDWRLSDHDVHSFSRAQEIIASELSAIGYGRVQIEPIDADLINNNVMGHYHHIGTTRMSGAPSDGVVNTDCRVHGVRNLYLGGSSVFPTAGYSGPTMMIIGLALRLAENLRRELG